MREVKPYKIWCRLDGIAHEVVMIDPHDGDEEPAHRIAQPHRPERHKCPKGRNLRGPQIQDEQRYENGEHPVGERALERDAFRWNRYRALALCLSMIFSENRVSTFPDHALAARQIFSPVARISAQRPHPGGDRAPDLVR